MLVVKTKRNTTRRCEIALPNDGKSEKERDRNIKRQKKVKGSVSGVFFGKFALISLKCF